jgi:hypothetical protein
MDFPTAQGEPWPGHLPCCHGPKDGCAAHNPNRDPIFWNSSLPSPIKPVTDGFLKSFFTTKAKHDTTQPELSSAITSLLPQTPSTLDPLPLIHTSVPYTLSLYHIHALLHGDNRSSTTNLQALTCHSTTTSSPHVTWRITPLHTETSTLLAHTYTLPVSLPLGAAATLADTSTYSHQKLPLLSPIHNTYSFRVCPHATLQLKTLTVKVSKGVASVRVEYGVRTGLGQEIREEWRSEVVRQPGEAMACGMCFTDFGVGFELAKKEVLVTVKVWKDLGVVDGMGGDKWEALRGGRAVKREEGDFGRVRRIYEEALDGNAVNGEGKDNGDVEQPETMCKNAGGEPEGEESLDDGHVVVDGIRPPPPYTP